MQREIVAQVVFTSDDPGGLWHEGDQADDLGWESECEDAPPVRVLRAHRHGEILTLTDPYMRGLIAEVHPYTSQDEVIAAHDVTAREAQSWASEPESLP